MIDRFEDLDKLVSPNYAYQRGKNAARLGLSKAHNIYGQNRPEKDELKKMLWDAWVEGYENALPV